MHVVRMKSFAIRERLQILSCGSAVGAPLHGYGFCGSTKGQAMLVQRNFSRVLVDAVIERQFGQFLSSKTQ